MEWLCILVIKIIEFNFFMHYYRYINIYAYMCIIDYNMNTDLHNLYFEITDLHVF